MEVIAKQPVRDVQNELEDIAAIISWWELAEDYFPHRSPSWFYNKLRARDGNGRPTDFTESELETLRGALFDLSDRIRQSAEKI